jgi:hypothetical protein
MWGAYLRAAATLAFAVLAAAVLQFIVSPLLGFLGPESSLLYRSFNGLAQNALLIMALAVGAGVIARAVTESGA